MNPLPSDPSDRARDAILRYGRDLDVKLFEYHFEAGSRDRAIEELTGYQNDDGGFGHRIEPNFRYTGSLPVSTSVGLQYAVELRLAP